MVGCFWTKVTLFKSRWVLGINGLRYDSRVGASPCPSGGNAGFGEKVFNLIGGHGFVSTAEYAQKLADSTPGGGACSDSCISSEQLDQYSQLTGGALGAGQVSIVAGSAALSSKVSIQILRKGVNAADSNLVSVGQWMSPSEYATFVKTGLIPRTNVLTKGAEGYIKQANIGDHFVSFKMNPSLLVSKNKALGWSLVKSNNAMYRKLAQQKGQTLPDPIGTDIRLVSIKE